MPEKLSDAHRSLNAVAGVAEVVILSTCNRTELVVGGNANAEQVAKWLCEYNSVAPADVNNSFYVHRGDDAVQHLTRVSAGLDSLVMGEPQIFGQMKSAYASAEAAGTVGSDLQQLFPHVFLVAKKVRTDTAIGQNPVSVAYSAVSLTQHIFSNLSKCSALLIGAGETIELAAKHLADKGVANMIIANRTLARAADLACAHNGHAIMLSDIPEHLGKIDIVIASTASQLPILGKGMVEQAMKKRKHRPILMVDIAVPRDIEAQVADVSDVYLYTLDDLTDIVNENRRARADEANKADEIINEGLQAWSEKQNLRGAASTVVDVRSQADELRQQELERGLKALERGDAPEKVIESLARNLTNKLLHAPSVQLRDAAAKGELDTIKAARQLFQLDDEGTGKASGSNNHSNTGTNE